MVPRGGFATKPTWRVQHLSREFCATKLWPKFQVDPINSRDREPRSTRGNLFAHSLLLCFSLSSLCLNSAFKIDKKLVVGLRTSLQDKEKKRGSTTTANARTDPTILAKTSHKTPRSAITRQTHHLELVRKCRPTSTSSSTPGPRVLGLDPSDLHSISLEKSTEGSHQSSLGRIAIHRPS